jgi:hypothetical protein
MQLVITPDGTLRCVYDEAVDLSFTGPERYFPGFSCRAGSGRVLAC